MAALVSQVGLSPASNGGGGGNGMVAVSPKSIVRLFQDIIHSPQFWDGLRVFGIGAAIASSKWLAETVWESLKSLVLCRAVLRGGGDGGDAYQWAMLYVTRHTHWSEDARDVEVTTKSKLVSDDFGPFAQTEDDSSDAGRTQQLINYSSISGETTASPGLEGVYLYPVESSTVRFRFRGTWVFATRSRSTRGEADVEERLDLSFLTWSNKVIREFLAEARRYYEMSKRGRIEVYEIDRYGYWSHSRTITRRLRDSLYLPSSIKTRALDDARRFLSPAARLWYGDRGIPYRRGFLLHGPPGTGKTSLAHVLASELQRPIYQVSLASGLNDSKFAELMTGVPSGSVVIVEDVDCAFASRGGASAVTSKVVEGVKEGKKEKASKKGQKQERKQRDDKKSKQEGDDEEDEEEDDDDEDGTDDEDASLPPGLTAIKSLNGYASPIPTTTTTTASTSLSFSGLLNAIDGITAGEARLLILTTNHRNRLDPALLRPGRVDMEFEFGNATRTQARELFERWYKPIGEGERERKGEKEGQGEKDGKGAVKEEKKEQDEKKPLSQEKNDAAEAENGSDDLEDTFVSLGVTPPPVPRAELLAAADVFARSTRPGVHSVAALQGFLLARMGQGPREVAEAWRRQEEGAAKAKLIDGGWGAGMRGSVK